MKLVWSGTVKQAAAQHKINPPDGAGQLATQATVWQDGAWERTEADYVARRLLGKRTGKPE